MHGPFDRRANRALGVVVHGERTQQLSELLGRPRIAVDQKLIHPAIIGEGEPLD